MGESSKALVLPQAGTAIATAPSYRPGRPLITVETLASEGQQRKLLMQYVDAHMRDGEDYGVIPGTGRKDAQGNEVGKKTLLKPGAEKLVDLFRCVPEYEIIEKVEDWDRPLFHYLFKCRIRTLESGAVVAEGVGACNTRESKYRYRNGERKCPTCGAGAIIKGKAEYGGGYICFAKKGGCGAKFRDGDREIEGQTVGKVDNPDVADSINTVLKMAKKRALVDAAISLVRCSDMFTQDAEDFAPEQPQRQEPRQPQTYQEELTVEELTVEKLSANKVAFWAAFQRTGLDWKQFLLVLNEQHKTAYTASDYPFPEVPIAIREWSAKFVIDAIAKQQKPNTYE